MTDQERERLTAFLRARVNPNSAIQDGADGAELWIGKERRGAITKDDEDPSDVSYSVALTFKTSAAVEDAEERLRELLNPAISLKSRKSLGRTQIEDSVEIYVGGEFMGLLYRDSAAGGFVEYNVEIQILPEDLEELS